MQHILSVGQKSFIGEIQVSLVTVYSYEPFDSLRGQNGDAKEDIHPFRKFVAEILIDCKQNNLLPGKYSTLIGSLMAPLITG
jgi:hypothetical protein